MWLRSNGKLKVALDIATIAYKVQQMDWQEYTTPFERQEYENAALAIREWRDVRRRIYNRCRQRGLRAKMKESA